MQPPPKFMHPEWVISNQSKYANAEGERAAAERLADEVTRVIDETTKTTMRVQRDVNKKFDQRITDIKYWDTEVDDKLNGLKQETDALQGYEGRLDKALEACREPLSIVQQCLLNRQGRVGIDLVHDQAEKELLKEVEVLQGAMALLVRSKEQTAEQLRLNRKVSYRLDKDLADKFAAMTVDQHSLEMKNGSRDRLSSATSSKLSNNYSTADQWEGFSAENIAEAEKQRQNTTALRAILDGVLQSTYSDILRQKNSADVALLKRIEETRTAKEKLEDHLAKVKQQIVEMDDNAERLKKAIDEKQDPLSLAQDRLEQRTLRPNVELCRDHVQYRLVEEVTIIGQSLSKLQQTLAAVEASIKGLLSRQIELEEDIEVKANTLYIDETLCMALRASINIQPF